MFKRFIASIVCITFIFSSFQPVQAQSFSLNLLPKPGSMVSSSKAFVPVLLKGLVIHPDQPFNFDFIVDSGNDSKDSAVIKEQSERMIRYFLTALTVPSNDLWVNLSPYEKDRIITNELGQTDMGRDMLAQDYMLKQLTASMIYPEKDLGKEFWSRVYKNVKDQTGDTNIPVNTFNKVWIVPNGADVFENGNAVYVTKSKLKVMLEEDYLSLAKHEGVGAIHESPVQNNQTHSAASQIVRDIVLPEIEKEVNEGSNFAVLRQVYSAAILAKWYREAVQKTIMQKIYIDQKKIAGVDLDDKTLKEQIYQRYIAAYKKGVFNYIKEENDSLTGQMVPRKYFSGGDSFAMNTIDLNPVGARNIGTATGGFFETSVLAAPAAAMASVTNSQSTPAMLTTIAVIAVLYFAGKFLFGSDKTEEYLEYLTSHPVNLFSEFLKIFEDIKKALAADEGLSIALPEITDTYSLARLMNKKDPIAKFLVQTIESGIIPSVNTVDSAFEGIVVTKEGNIVLIVANRQYWLATEKKTEFLNLPSATGGTTLFPTSGEVQVLKQFGPVKGSMEVKSAVSFAGIQRYVAAKERSSAAMSVLSQQALDLSNKIIDTMTTSVAIGHAIQLKERQRYIEIVTTNLKAINTTLSTTFKDFQYAQILLRKLQQVDANGGNLLRVLPVEETVTLLNDFRNEVASAAMSLLDAAPYIASAVAGVGAASVLLKRRSDASERKLVISAVREVIENLRNFRGPSLSIDGKRSEYTDFIFSSWPLKGIRDLMFDLGVVYYPHGNGAYYTLNFSSSLRFSKAKRAAMQLLAQLEEGLKHEKDYADQIRSIRKNSRVGEDHERVFLSGGDDLMVTLDGRRLVPSNDLSVPLDSWSSFQAESPTVIDLRFQNKNDSQLNSWLSSQLYNDKGHDIPEFQAIENEILKNHRKVRWDSGQSENISALQAFLNLLTSEDFREQLRNPSAEFSALLASKDISQIYDNLHHWPAFVRTVLLRAGVSREVLFKDNLMSLSILERNATDKRAVGVSSIVGSRYPRELTSNAQPYRYVIQPLYDGKSSFIGWTFPGFNNDQPVRVEIIGDENLISDFVSHIAYEDLLEAFEVHQTEGMPGFLRILRDEYASYVGANAPSAAMAEVKPVSVWQKIGRVLVFWEPQDTQVRFGEGEFRLDLRKTGSTMILVPVLISSHYVGDSNPNDSMPWFDLGTNDPSFAKSRRRAIKAALVRGLQAVSMANSKSFERITTAIINAGNSVKTPQEFLDVANRGEIENYAKIDILPKQGGVIANATFNGINGNSILFKRPAAKLDTKPESLNVDEIISIAPSAAMAEIMPQDVSSLQRGMSAVLGEAQNYRFKGKRIEKADVEKFAQVIKDISTVKTWGQLAQLARLDTLSPQEKELFREVFQQRHSWDGDLYVASTSLLKSQVTSLRDIQAKVDPSRDMFQTTTESNEKVSTLFLNLIKQNTAYLDAFIAASSAAMANADDLLYEDEKEFNGSKVSIAYDSEKKQFMIRIEYTQNVPNVPGYSGGNKHRINAEFPAGNDKPAAEELFRFTIDKLTGFPEEVVEFLTDSIRQGVVMKEPASKAMAKGQESSAAMMAKIIAAVQDGVMVNYVTNSNIEIEPGRIKISDAVDSEISPSVGIAMRTEDLAKHSFSIEINGESYPFRVEGNSRSVNISYQDKPLIQLSNNQDYGVIGFTQLANATGNIFVNAEDDNHYLYRMPIMFTLSQDGSIVMLHIQNSLNKTSVNFISNAITSASRVLTSPAMAPEKVVRAPASAAMDNGGIDLNQIDVNRSGHGVDLQFNAAQISGMTGPNFKGFQIIVNSVTPIQSPLPLLGINENSVKDSVKLAKV